HAGQTGGVSDVDMYLNKGTFLINLASDGSGVNADRLLIKGKMNPRGCTNDLTGATVTIRINGTPIAPPAELNAKGRFASPAGAAQSLRYKFSCLNGTYQFLVGGVDLATLVGQSNTTASFLLPVTIEIEIQGAGLATPVVTGDFEFACK